MPVDTRGLREKHVGKRLRIELPMGQVEEVTLLELTVCQEPEPCCGITYRLLYANHRHQSKKEGSVYWVGFGDIKYFQVLGERLA
jgi:hypothetical protein